MPTTRSGRKLGDDTAHCSAAFNFNTNTNTGSGSSVAAPPQPKVFFPTFNIKDVHITGCKPQEIDAMRFRHVGFNYHSWDYTHVNASIDSLLGDNPGNHLYIYGFATSYCAESGHQAPMYAGFLMPAELGAPTNSMCVVNNQTSEEEVFPFDRFGYFWKQSVDLSHKGRVYFLACNKDLESISVDDALMHEYAVFFMVSPNDLLTNHKGSLDVDRVMFSFTQLDGEIVYHTWFKKEEPLGECIDGILFGHFEDEVEELDLSTEEKEEMMTNIRDKVRRTALAALEDTREQKQVILNSFFHSVHYSPEDLGEINLSTLFPINFPAPVKTKLPGKYMDRFWQQLGDSHRRVISDHFSASAENAGLLQRLPHDVLTVVSVEDPSSSTHLLQMLLIIDFALANNGFGGTSNSFYPTTTTQVNAFLDDIISIFGLQRIVQYMGDRNPMKIEMDKVRYMSYINGLIVRVKQAIERIGRQPSSVVDFLSNFLFEESPGHRGRNNLFGVDSIRLKASTNTLQVHNGRWIDTCVHDLDSIISPEGLVELLLNVLLHPSGAAVAIPAGARDDSADGTSQVNNFNCVKASLLLTSNEVLSPSGKKRVEKALPDHEIPMDQLRHNLKESVVTVQLKQVKADIHTTAMTGTDEMLGIFHDEGQRKHCVYINGREGTISDPVEGYGIGLARTDESLRMLGIAEFCELLTVNRKRDELSHSTRMKYQKKTGFPFF